MLGCEFRIAHRTARRERRGPNEEKSFTTPSWPGCEPGFDYLLAPDLRRVDIDSESDLFPQLSPQGGQWRLAVFDATPRE